MHGYFGVGTCSADAGASCLKWRLKAVVRGDMTANLRPGGIGRDAANLS